MNENKFGNQPQEVLIQLLVDKTSELLQAVDNRASKVEIHAIRKEVEQIQRAIAGKNPEIHLR